MALERDFYRALEDIVGLENVSEDPVVLYSYVPLRPSMAAMGAAMPTFAAVTLPRDTREVQAIVRLCNKHKVLFKAASTSWGRYSDPNVPGVVKLDLRRMNRILEINEKNERMVREEMRAKHGMDALAKKLLPVFDSMLKKQKNVVADGLYSWEEYVLLKKRYGAKLKRHG